MAKNVSVGGENFAALWESGSYYVYKAEILRKLIETKNSVTLLIRPRRFGKTLMMSIMESYFDIRQKSKALFEGLDVDKNEGFFL